MKHQTKVQTALARRRAAFTSTMPSGQRCHQPGSQNRKKGASAQKKA